MRNPLVLVLFTIVTASSFATVNTWLGTGDADWHHDPASNWSLGRVPEAGDEVVINHSGAQITLSETVPATGSLASFSIGSGSTLTMTNWTTALRSDEITVLAQGLITCAGPFTNAPAMSNRVWLICQDLTVAKNGSINVNGKGYAGAVSNQTERASGPGGGAGYGDGGSYGGYCGGSGYSVSLAIKPVVPEPYGDPKAPADPGSGGTCLHNTAIGGNGGGAVRIEASDSVVLNGAINANGSNRIGNPLGGQAGGGSGGGVYITCRTIDGSGQITANGGLGQAHGGHGSGGRIAIVYDTEDQAAIPSPALSISATPHGPFAQNNVHSSLVGEPGTVYLPDAALLHTNLNVAGQIMLECNAWAPESLTVDNIWARFATPGFSLNVAGNLTIRKGKGFGQLDIGGSSRTNFVAGSGYTTLKYRNYQEGPPPVLRVGGDLIVTDNGTFALYSTATNGVAPDYGALAEVAGTIHLSANSWVYPVSHWENGGSPLFRAQHLYISPDSGFNATRLGFASSAPPSYGYGPGGGNAVSGGGSYGGKPENASEDKIYGDPDAPLHPGSGAQSSNRDYQGAFGGGLIRLEVEKTCTLLGTLTSDGINATGGHSGGGAGGGIFITCRTFSDGESTVIQANGGSRNGNTSYATGGGGGRIAVWRVWDASPVTVVPTALGANGSSDGSVVMGLLPPEGSLLILR